MDLRTKNILLILIGEHNSFAISAFAEQVINYKLLKAELFILYARRAINHARKNDLRHALVRDRARAP